jgi:hypothetical protein
VNPPDRDDVTANVTAIINHSFLPATRTEKTVKGEFLPVTQTPEGKRMFELYVRTTPDTGFQTAGEFTGGLRGFRVHRRARCRDDPRGWSCRKKSQPSRRIHADRRPGPARAGMRAGDCKAGRGETVKFVKFSGASPSLDPNSRGARER